MPSHHRLEKKLPHEVDITGIAVALAFLVIVGVFAGGQGNRTVSEDGQPPPVSMQVAPTLAIEETEALQQPEDKPDLSDTSLTLSAPAESRSAHHSVTP